MNRDDDWQSPSNDHQLVWRGRQAPAVPGGRGVSTQVRYEIDDEEPRFNLLQYTDILFKHRWLIAGAVAAMVALGLVWTLLTTPIYRATTVVQIESDTPQIVDMQGVEASGDRDRDFYQTQYALLQSRSLAERVVDRLNLSHDEAFMSQHSSSPMGAVRNLFNRQSSAIPSDPARARRVAVRRLTSQLSIEPVPGSHLVRIHYENPDRNIAARISNAVADNFIGANLDRRFEATAYARKFLEERLAQVKAKLETTEEQLVKYASDQKILDIQTTNSTTGEQSSQSLPASDLLAMNAALAQAKTERIRAEQRWRQAASGDAAALPEVLSSPTIQTLRASRAALQAQYQEKLSIYKPDYPEMVQLRAQIDEVDRQIAAETKNVKDSLHAQYQVALRQEQSLQSQVGSLTSGVLDLRNRSIQYNILQREVDTNRTLYNGLLQRYKEIGVAGGVGTNNVSIVDKAEPPGAPYKPNLMMNLLTATALGLLLGIAAAVGLESLDETIKVPEDIEGKLGIPLLGSIPVLEKGVTPEEALADSRSAFSEAYYSLRTALQFSTDHGVPPNLLVTSARPSEGKSTTAIALARNFAKLGMRVLLVDADLRNPSLHRVMQCENSAGLSNYLTGRASLDEVVQPTDHPNLGFMPCGPLPPNPAELLAGPRVRALLNEAAQQVDLMIIDGPPVMGLADAPLLASATAGTMVVVEAGTTRQRVVKAALRRLDLGHAHVLGALLSKFSMRKAGYSYGYGYGYSYAYSYDYGVKKIEGEA